MAEEGIGYRAFPATVTHPKHERRYSLEQFTAIPKTRLEDAPSLYLGHEGTTVWYAEARGYIVEVKFAAHPPVFIHSICTFTPTHGMDRIDGEIAQTAVDYVLREVLNYESQRLNSLPQSEEISIEHYLKITGLIK